MRRAPVLLALLAVGCGGTGAELPDGADESYTRWRADVEGVCQKLRERVEDLPDPNSEVGDGSDEEKLRQLADAAQPIADLYVDAARETASVPLPRARADVSRDYAAAFTRRAENYAAIPGAAAAGDRKAVETLTDRDGTLSKRLAFATEQAGVRC
jgi:hypothetical protein